MNKKLSAIAGLMVLAGVIIVAVAAYSWLADQAESPDILAIHEHENDPPPEEYPDSQTEEYTEDTNPQAPDFIFYDIDGNEMRLSDFFGKPIVLNFWTTWCPSCVREMPYFQQLYEEHGDEIHILKINLLDGIRETRERVDRFIADNDYNFPIYFDGGDGGRVFGVRFIPMTFFIDARGNALAHTQGAVDGEILRQGLALIGVGE